MDEIFKKIAIRYERLASIAWHIAQGHGRSTYSEPGEALTLDDVYTEAHAKERRGEGP
jgi:hypothetical protein